MPGSRSAIQKIFRQYAAVAALSCTVLLFLSERWPGMIVDNEEIQLASSFTIAEHDGKTVMAR